MRVCQERELKSTSESIPDPNMKATKHNEIIAMSPNMWLVREEVAKSRIVKRDIIITVMFLLPTTLFLSYTITGMEVMSLGFSTTIISNQHMTVQINEKGTAAAIQFPNETSTPACSRYETARAF